MFDHLVRARWVCVAWYLASVWGEMMKFSTFRHRHVSNVCSRHWVMLQDKEERRFGRVCHEILDDYKRRNRSKLYVCILRTNIMCLFLSRLWILFAVLWWNLFASESSSKNQLTVQPPYLKHCVVGLMVRIDGFQAICKHEGWSPGCTCAETKQSGPPNTQALGDRLQPVGSRSTGELEHSSLSRWYPLMNMGNI